MQNAPSTPPDFSEKKRRSAGGKFLLGTVLTIGIVVLLLVVVAAFFSRQITKRVLAEVGKNLKTEIKLGDADLSLLAYFPDASVIFKNVRAKDAFGSTLLDAEEVSFRFGLFSLFSNTVELKSVVIRSGTIRLRFDKNGQPNYEIFKDKSAKKSKPTEQKDLAIDLKLAELADMNVIYEDDQTNQNDQFFLKKATFAGNFSAKRFNLDTQAEGMSQFINLDGDRFMVNQPIGWEAVVAVDLSRSAYLLQKVDLSLGDNVFNINGAVVGEENATNLNLKFASKEGDVSVLFSLLPESAAAYFKDFKSSGRYSCGGYVHGRAGKGRRPNLNLDLSLSGGEINSPKLEKSLRDVRFKANFELSPDGPGGFSVENFQAKLDDEPVNLSLRVTNVDDPEVDFSFSGALPLASSYGLFNEPRVTDGEGRIVCKSLKINGKYKDMTSMRRVAAVNTSGVIEFEEAGLKFNGAWIEAPRGRVRLSDNVLSLDTIELKIKGSDLAFGGVFKNFLPVLLADSLNSKDAALEFSANLSAEKLDLDELLAINSVAQNVRGGASQVVVDSLKKDKNETRARFTDLLFGTFDVRIGHFNYQKIDAENFVGKLSFNRQELIVNGDLASMGGSLHLEGNAFFEEKPRLKARFVVKNIDLQESFRQCENFGQQTLKEKNLRGRLDARVAVNAFWDEKGKFLENKLRVLADLQASNGELLNLPMLDDFSTYIHAEDLRHVKFTSLQNYLEVSNRTVFLPAMFIQSNAANLTVAGKQTFDDDIDYKIKVNAGQVLMNRLKKHDGSLQPMPEKNGWFNLHYSMCCHLENYTVKLDKRGVKTEFEQSEGRKKIIAAALDAEFRGIDVSLPTAENLRFKKDDDEFLPEMTAGGSKPQPTKKLQKQEEDEYIPGF